MLVVGGRAGGGEGGGREGRGETQMWNRNAAQQAA